MFIDFIIEVFRQNEQNEAVIYRDSIYTYYNLLKYYYAWLKYCKHNIPQGSIIAVQADYSPLSISFILALIENRNIIVPLSYANKDVDKKVSISEAELLFHLEGDKFDFERTSYRSSHSLVKELRSSNHPGIVIFSSGSTGEPKAALHDFANLLNKFKVQRRTYRTINFLLFDHWGGLNTLLYILSNAGVVGIMEDRSPEKVCEFIEKHRIELLPTTPTFLNLMLISGVYEKYDLSSLKVVSYGTEPMPESTLKAFHGKFPHVILKQTYGLTELGVMRTKSLRSDSLWLQVGGEDYLTKIVDNTLYVKAKSSILGYLNAPSPFDEDGWYNTGDKVEVDGEWIRFLGRESDIINVGGQKVFPAEVESVILEMDNVRDASVHRENNRLLGSVVALNVSLYKDEAMSSFKSRMREYCRVRLESYKIPVVIKFVDNIEVSDRYKKLRK